MEKYFINLEQAENFVKSYINSLNDYFSKNTIKEVEGEASYKFKYSTLPQNPIGTEYYFDVSAKRIVNNELDRNDYIGRIFIPVNSVDLFLCSTSGISIFLATEDSLPIRRSFAKFCINLFGDEYKNGVLNWIEDYKHKIKQKYGTGGEGNKRLEQVSESYKDIEDLIKILSNGNTYQ